MIQNKKSSVMDDDFQSGCSMWLKVKMEQLNFKKKYIKKIQ